MPSVHHLATCLSKNRHLIDLNVSENGLGGSKLESAIVLSKGFDSLMSLAEALAVNKALLRLDLRGNYINKLAMKEVGSALAKNKVICRLLIGEDAEFLEVLKSGLKKNWSVTDLGCGDGVGKVATYLARNRKHRDDFLKALASDKGLSKVQAALDKGVDILAANHDKGDGPSFLIKDLAAADIVEHLHTVHHVRNYIFSNTEVFQVLPRSNLRKLKASTFETFEL